MIPACGISESFIQYAHFDAEEKGIGKKYKESDDEYKTAITNDINKAQEYIKSITGNAPTAFIYPFGEESGSKS